MQTRLPVYQGIPIRISIMSDDASPPRDSERLEAFRHPEPDCPDPIAELQSISDGDMERICGVFVRRMYPEGKFSRTSGSAWGMPSGTGSSSAESQRRESTTVTMRKW
jgi:hypothetical protein